MEVTQELLKRRYRYNPITGLMCRRYRQLSDCLSIAGQTRWTHLIGVPITTVTNGYIKTVVEGKSYQLHNLIWLYMTGDWPRYTIDHIEGVTTDNRWNKLRDTKDNNKNKTISALNTTGITGVYTYADKWRVTITSNYVRHYLGQYTSLFEACCRRKSAELKFGFHKNHGRKQ